ncbi:hypothetical protein FSP39_003185 [Pinctada imbricata]|uniref:Flavin-containing monooxygenase n=1 Tax=Pinctada imbricata TaxID=66713 RepID=A0AA88XCE0_PINIB|nr:hypothetical protein FSP39_003185 [Pinctada imbricata]
MYYNLSSHWNEYIPDIKGKDDFKGIFLHSRNYRHVEVFEGLDVAILGGFRTAEDVALQIEEKARKVYVCHRTPDFPVSFPKSIEQRPPFVRMTEKGVVFPDGNELNVDAVIFCTGYRYTFPYLKDGLINITENRIIPLYKHIVHMKYPSLVFPGVPQPYAYFPFLHQTAKFAVRVIDGRIKLPSEQEMVEESADDYKSRIQEGFKPKYAHFVLHHMWDLDKELSKLGQFEHLPPVLEKLLEDILDERKMNITHAHELNYQITGSNSYRILNPDGSKSRKTYATK